MGNYQDRVIEEHGQLSDKIMALESFIVDQGGTVTERELGLLSIQLRIMESYSEVLAERIVNFT